MERTGNGPLFFLAAQAIGESKKNSD